MGELNGVLEFGFGCDSELVICVCLRGSARMARIGLGTLSGVSPAGRHVGLANVEEARWALQPELILRPATRGHSQPRLHRT